MNIIILCLCWVMIYYINIVYDFCSIIANKFMLSAEYKQYNMSMYDCLVNWIENNIENIGKIWKDVN